jgi:hypothetical protein
MMVEASLAELAALVALSPAGQLSQAHIANTLGSKSADMPWPSFSPGARLDLLSSRP